MSLGQLVKYLLVIILSFMVGLLQTSTQGYRYAFKLSYFLLYEMIIFRLSLAYAHFSQSPCLSLLDLLLLIILLMLISSLIIVSLYLVIYIAQLYVFFFGYYFTSFPSFILQSYIVYLFLHYTIIYVVLSYEQFFIPDQLQYLIVYLNLSISTFILYLLSSFLQ